MLYSEIIAVCSQIHTKHINTLCGQNVECRTYRAVNTLRHSYFNFIWCVFCNVVVLTCFVMCGCVGGFRNVWVLYCVCLCVCFVICGWCCNIRTCICRVLALFRLCIFIPFMSLFNFVRYVLLLFEIHKLITSIWKKEKLPEELKESITLPIHKKGDKPDCNNYRGI